MKKMVEALAGDSKTSGLLKKCLAILLIVVFSLLFLNVMLNDSDGRNSVVSVKDSNIYSSSEKTSDEIRLENILQCMAGVGDAEVMIKSRKISGSSFLTEESNETGDVEGIIVVAEGAANAVTRSEISEAAATLCNISPSDVIVFEMSSDRITDHAGDAS